METVFEVAGHAKNAGSRRLRILYLLDYLHGFGGTERHVFQLATSLDPQRFSCTVCPMDYRQDMIELFAEAGIDIIPKPFVRIYDLNGIRQIHALSMFVRERRFDVIQTFNIASDIVGIIAGKLAGIPIIISSRRDMGQYRKTHHLMVTNVLNRYVTHFIAVCNATAEQMTRKEGIQPERITTIYNGLDQSTLAVVNSGNVAALRQSYAIGPEDFIIGYVAHFRPEKGHQVLFEALRILKPKIPRLKILTVGVGSTLSSIKRFVEQHGLTDSAFFPGYVDNVLDYVSLMDVCCFTPVSNEGFSNALLEQMSLAKPIIATDMGGNAEIIEHQVSGLIVPPNNVEALAKAIQHLYYHPETRTIFADNARLRVPEKFSMNRMLTQTEALYLRLFGRVVGQTTSALKLYPE